MFPLQHDLRYVALCYIHLFFFFFFFFTGGAGWQRAVLRDDR